MTIGLNAAQATFIAAMALCAAALDLMSAPKEGRWFKLPSFIRWEIRITSGGLLLRAAMLYQMPSDSRSQADVFTFLISFLMCATVVSLTGYALSLRLPFRAWARLRFASRTMRADPDMVPVMVHKSEVTDIAHASGLPAVGAGEGAGAVVREAARAGLYAPRSRASR